MLEASKLEYVRGVDTLNKARAAANGVAASGWGSARRKTRPGNHQGHSAILHDGVLLPHCLPA